MMSPKPHSNVRRCITPLSSTLAVVALACASSARAAAQADAPLDFGSPPSGTIGVLLDDRHVYVRPTKLERGRVLAALQTRRTILVPARSLIEALGGSVVVTDGGRTIRVTNRATTIVLTAGRRDVVIDGTARPLDVPPEVVDGVLYMPIRVVTEGLGAYVAWDDARKLVIIRSAARPAVAAQSTPAPQTALEPAPSGPPVTPPRAAPVATVGAKTRAPYVRFVSVNLNLAPKVYDEFSPGNTGRITQTIRGAVEFNVSLFGHDLRRFFAVEDQRLQYPHLAAEPTARNGVPCSAPGGAGPSVRNPGCVSVIGGNGSAYVNTTELSENDLAIHSSIIGSGHTYLAASYLLHTNSYGYPRLNSTFGFGFERLPDLSRPFSLYANAYYYPEVHGSYTTAAGDGLELRYKQLCRQEAISAPFGRSTARRMPQSR